MELSVLTVYQSPFKKFRYGKDFDGGYVTAKIPNLVYDLFIGCGINDDISFEEDFLKEYDYLKCHLFDGNIQKLPEITGNPYNLIFTNKNIAPYNDDKNTNLHELIDKYNNIILKMDIEGAEINWLNSLSYQHMNKLQQIVIEFHNPFGPCENQIFKKINLTHYLIHFHANNCSCGVINVINYINVSVPVVFECTYVHKRHFSTPPLLNTEPIPSSIDMRNVQQEPEININYPPFVHPKPFFFF